VVNLYSNIGCDQNYPRESILYEASKKLILIIMTGELYNYVHKGHKHVQGWLSPLAKNLITQLGEIQDSYLDIQGPVCEIGVHHGKSFILLHHLTRPGEKSVAWDLFDRQEENEDFSGCGNKQIFERNLVKHKCRLDDIEVFTENSKNLDVEKVNFLACGNPRFFSVDGGHTSQITKHDLMISFNSMCDKGIVILDDFLNKPWPGVTDGFYRFIYEENNFSRIYLIAIGGNKLFFTNNKEAAKIYQAKLNKRYLGFSNQFVEILGQNVLTIINEQLSIKSKIKYSVLKRSTLKKVDEAS
jgi:hypothetical protein